MLMSKSHSEILAFCHLRKTGGISLNQILRRQFGIHHLDAIVRFQPGTKLNQPFYSLEHLSQDRKIYPKIRSIAGHYLCPAIDYGELGSRFRWITILRDPLRRYVSHYGQHVEKMGVTTDFEPWLSIEKHHNDQVKTIAGEANLEKAKEILERQFVLGFLEAYELSMLVIRELLPQFELDMNYRQKSNPAKGIINAKELAEKYADRIRENNQLDQQLYDFAWNVLWKRQLERVDLPRLEAEVTGMQYRSPTIGQQMRLFAARLKRNLLYKPYVRWQQP